MAPPVPSPSGPVYLRALDVSDVDRTLRWHNDETTYSTLLSNFRHVSPAAETEWIRRKTAFSHTEVNLAICLHPDGRHIGNVYLRHIDWISRTCEFGIFIGEPDCRGKGHGGTATRLTLRHAFLDLGLRRVSLFALAENTGAAAMYERCGFRREGLLRKHVLKRGRAQDVLVMGTLAEDHPDLAS